MLNAFRHLVYNHNTRSRLDARAFAVLNAFRHLVYNHTIDLVICQVFVWCSTPFGIWYIITPEFQVGYAVVIQCSTPFGIWYIITVNLHFRQGGRHLCSTPFGIWYIITRQAVTSAVFRPRAQRLSASGI